MRPATVNEMYASGGGQGVEGRSGGEYDGALVVGRLCEGGVKAYGEEDTRINSESNGITGSSGHNITHGQKVDSGSSQMGEGTFSTMGKGDLVLYDVAQQSRILGVIVEETPQIEGMKADQIGTVAVVPMGEEYLLNKTEVKTGKSKRTWKRALPKERRLIRDCGVVIKEDSKQQLFKRLRDFG
ncbi:aspartyl/glutamyl-tRNA(Asn/Gln) amidotransferasesubunit B, partial [Striga asiatica]